MAKVKRKPQKKNHKLTYNNIIRLVLLGLVVIAVVSIVILSSRSESTSGDSPSKLNNDGRGAADEFVQAITNCDFEVVKEYYSVYRPDKDISEFKNGCVKDNIQFKFYKNGPADLNSNPDENGISTKAAIYVYRVNSKEDDVAKFIVLNMVWNDVDNWKVLSESTTPFSPF